MEFLKSDLLIKFMKFGLVGISGTLVDFGITYFLKEVVKINKFAANSTGFLCAVLSNYYLNRIWTFHSSDPAVAVQFSKFFVISMVGLGINNGIIYWLNEKRNTNFYVAKIAATGVVMIWNFWANLLFTFART